MDRDDADAQASLEAAINEAQAANNPNVEYFKGLRRELEEMLEKEQVELVKKFQRVDNKLRKKHGEKFTLEPNVDGLPLPFGVKKTTSTKAFWILALKVLMRAIIICEDYYVITGWGPYGGWRVIVMWM